MGLRFRRRVRLFPGLWLNASKSGITTSIGGDGVTVNYGRRGTRTTLSAHGTGLAYSWLRRPAPFGSSKARSGPLARFVCWALWLCLLGCLAAVLR